MSRSDINITIGKTKLDLRAKKFERAIEAMRRFGEVANRVWRDVRSFEADEANTKRGRD
jgi:hypothetical protein